MFARDSIRPSPPGSVLTVKSRIMVSQTLRSRRQAHLIFKWKAQCGRSCPSSASANITRHPHAGLTINAWKQKVFFFTLAVTSAVSKQTLIAPRHLHQWVCKLSALFFLCMEIQTNSESARSRPTHYCPLTLCHRLILANAPGNIPWANQEGEGKALALTIDIEQQNIGLVFLV